MNSDVVLGGHFLPLSVSPWRARSRGSFAFSRRPLLFGDPSSGAGCCSLDCGCPCWDFGENILLERLNAPWNPSNSTINCLLQMEKLRHNGPDEHPVLSEWDQANPLPPDPAPWVYTLTTDTEWALQLPCISCSLGAGPLYTYVYTARQVLL